MNVQIAQRLAELRRAKGYSQEALANRLGLSRQAVSKWERAESSPDTENLIALARLYGVSLDELLSVDKDIEEDIAFEHADRVATTAQVAAGQAADREAAAQAVAAATQASQAAARAAEAASQATSQVTRASVDAERLRVKGPWRSFPYGILMIPLWFVLTLAGAAPFSFLVFFSIPVYHWLANIMDGAMARETTPCPAVDGEAASSQGASGRGPSRAAASEEPAAADAAAVGRGGRPVDPRGVEGGR